MLDKALSHHRLEATLNKLSLRASDAQFTSGKSFSENSRSFDDSLIDGLDLLDDGGSDDLTFEDRLNLLNDGSLDGLLHDRGVHDSGRASLFDLAGGSHQVGRDGSPSHHHVSSHLRGQVAVLDHGGLDLGLV